MSDRHLGEVVLRALLKGAGSSLLRSSFVPILFTNPQVLDL